MTLMNNAGSKCYTLEDLMLMLDISRNTLMKLLCRNEFPWFKVGTSYRIPKEAFNTWLNGDSRTH